MENSLAMNCGEGPNSYFKNSKIQENVFEAGKILMMNSIIENLEVENQSKVFSIADLGCSVGPNTFSCVKTIIEAVQHKYIDSPDAKIPEFHVFFNDLVNNDFNTLFKALPADRQYFAAGVPGSYHGRLFPKSAMNLMHSVFALHWLSKIPQEVMKEDSPAWNKGKITYVRSSTEVIEAFRAQFFSDMKDFLKARTEELVPNGLLIILMPCREEGTLPSKTTAIHAFECFGDALNDMVKENIISEDLVNSFNLPIFYPTTSEVKELVSSNKKLNIERCQEIYIQPRLSTLEDVQFYKAHMRAVLGVLFCEHFGSKVVDEIFDRFPQKLENFMKTPEFTRVDKVEFMFLLAKRN